MIIGSTLIKSTLLSGIITDTEVALVKLVGTTESRTLQCVTADASLYDTEISSF